MTAKITRVTDQIIALETSPVIFSANEMSVFMWVCGLLISCLKKILWWVVCVCTETPYESHAWATHTFLAPMYVRLSKGLCEQLLN